MADGERDGAVVPSDVDDPVAGSSCLRAGGLHLRRYRCCQSYSIVRIRRNTFMTASGLRRHWKTRHVGLTLDCPFCELVFVGRGGQLKRHTEEMEPGEVEQMNGRGRGGDGGE